MKRCHCRPIHHRKLRNIVLRRAAIDCSDLRAHLLLRILLLWLARRLARERERRHHHSALVQRITSSDCTTFVASGWRTLPTALLRWRGRELWRVGTEAWLRSRSSGIHLLPQLCKIACHDRRLGPIFRRRRLSLEALHDGAHLFCHVCDSRGVRGRWGCAGPGPIAGGQSPLDLDVLAGVRHCLGFSGGCCYSS